MMRVLLVVVALSFSVTSEAFNRDRCGQLFPKYEDYHPPYYSPLYVSTMIPSTSSYFTSTGPCSMYGDASLRRAMFIHDNYDLIVKDASRGQGEHIETLAMLSGCQVRCKNALPLQ